MKNKKLYTLTAMAGLTLGTLGVASVASAEPDSVPEATVETSVEAETSDAGFARIQDVDGEAPDAATEGRRSHRRGGCNVDTAAEAIGIEAEDLKGQLEAGATIAEVAEANGVSVDTVIDAMVDAKTERIAEKVEAGRITEDEADEKLAELEDRITDRVIGESEDDA